MERLKLLQSPKRPQDRLLALSQLKCRSCNATCDAPMDIEHVHVAIDSQHRMQHIANHDLRGLLNIPCCMAAMSFAI